MVEAVNSGDSLADANGPATIKRPRAGACPVAERLLAGGRLTICRWAKGILSADEAMEDDQLGTGDGEGCESSGELEKDTEQDGEEAMK